MNLKQFVQEGKIRPHRTSLKEITDLFELVDRDIRDASVAFSDTGYGIKQGKLHTIFALFVTTKASTEGAGMGLYNAKGFVIRHKGRIWAESEGGD